MNRCGCLNGLDEERRGAFLPKIQKRDRLLVVHAMSPFVTEG
jgi:hypothetical protein